jgi:hypothetical protein
LIIEFINASFEQVPGKGPNAKSYGKALVTFKGDRGVKTQTVLSFANPMVYAALEGLKQGDKLDVTMAKNASGFWQWESITPASNTPNTEVSASAPSNTPTSYAPSNSKPNTYATRDFETKEERAQRQALIVRQSSLNNAITILSTGSKVPPAVPDVLNLAEQLVQWVYDSPKQDPAPKGSGFDDMENDIPY